MGGRVAPPPALDRAVTPADRATEVWRCDGRDGVASDEELEELTRRVLNGELTGQVEIKWAVRNWRADHRRI